MANPKHHEILRQGVDAWNRWRCENPEVTPDLSGANLRKSDFGGEGERAINFASCELRGAHFERSILWGANFENANLDAANLRHANLSNANFREASLQAADLSGADLIHTDFTNANLYKATLRDADLERSNLANARSLSADQLAGTGLFQTTLPGPIASFPALRIVDELSKNARTLVVSMLGACAYCWLTILQTEDFSLIARLDSTSAKLPIINVDLPIFAFYAIAPYILLGLYLYVHITLSRLWSTLSVLPAIFPSGEPLTSVVYSWLPPDVICKFIPRLRGQKQAFWRMQRWITVLLVWMSVPVTILLFWTWYVTAHEWAVTIAHIFLAAGSAAAAAIFYRSIGATLSPPRGRRGYLRRSPRRIAIGRMIPAFSILMVCLFLSYGALNVSDPTARQDENKSTSAYHRFLRGIAKSSLFRADINARDFDASNETPIRLAGSDLAYINARGVNFSRANLSGADLRYGDLDSAKFDGANLSQADLRGVRSDNATFPEGTLTGSRFEFSELRSTDFSSVVASQATFHGAILDNAKFLKAELYNASFAGAVLQRADFTQAILDHADMSETDLTDANFEGARLNGTNLQGALLERANFLGADLTGVVGLDATDFKKNAMNWQKAFYDETAAATLGLPRNHNECDMMLQLHARYYLTESQPETQ